MQEEQNELVTPEEQITPQETPQTSETPVVEQQEVEVPVTEDKAPETETPETTEAPVAEVEQPVTEEKAPETAEAVEPEISPEELERQQQEAASRAQLKQVMEGILALELKEFEEATAQSSLHELSMLMDLIANEPLDRKRVRMAGKLKKAHDSRYEAEIARLKDVSPDDKEGQAEKQLVSDYSFKFSEDYGTFIKAKEIFEEEDKKNRGENTEKKEELLKQLREVVLKEDPKLLKDVQKIQNAWKEIGPVQPFKAEEIYESYKALLDQFYGFRSNYLDLLDQDRKVNQEKKEALIAELEALSNPTEEQAGDPTYWNSSGERINTLHAEYKEIGPAPRKVADDLWSRFRKATNTFYETRRAFYATRDELKEKNQDIKEQMLEQVQPYTGFQSEDVAAWQAAANELKTLQEQWFAQGPAPKEVNTELNRKFKGLVNEFFNAKNAFFKGLEDQRMGLVKKKQELADEAEQLKESENWDETANRLKFLQAEWKKTGPDTFKEARKVQRQFRKACDLFFKRLKDRHKAVLEKEEENLKAKQAIVAELNTLTEGKEKLEEAAKAELTQQAEAIKAKYEALGDVPRKAIGKINGQWQGAWNAYLTLVVDDPKKLERIQQENKYLAIKNEKGEEALDRERKRMYRMIKELEEEIDQYQNNILFIAKGKKGDGLRAEINKKIEQAEKKKAKLDKEFRMLKQVAK